MQRIEHQGFLLLLVAITLAFAWILQPFYGAVLWAVVVAVIFAPVYRKLLARMGDRRSLAAAITVLIIIAIVILPLVMVALAVFNRWLVWIPLVPVLGAVLFMVLYRIVTPDSAGKPKRPVIL